MPLQALDFERIFASGARHELPRGDVVTVRLRQDTSLWLPSGRVVADELLVLDDGDGGFIQQAPPGQYPLVLVIAAFAKRSYLRAHEMVAAARLVIRDEPVVSWEMAVYHGQDVSGLGDDEFFGYPVDGGTGGFIDAANIAPLREDSEYNDRVMTALYGSESGDTAAGTLTDGDGRPLVVVFSSGGGDGHYPTWVGRTAGGEVGCFLTDFFILTDDKESKDATVGGDGGRLPGNEAASAPDVARGPLSPVVTSPTGRTTARPLSTAQHVTPFRTTVRRTVQ